jgi:hypothetical protein
MVSAHGAFTDDMPRSIGGVVLTITALTLIVLFFVRVWVVNTDRERERLDRARHDADAEQRRFFAMQAAQESEMTRLTRDMREERAKFAMTMLAEREALATEFEKNRLQIATQAFQTGVEMERAGLLKPDEPTPPPANLIQFPDQSRAPERERSREHGSVGP